MCVCVLVWNIIVTRARTRTRTGGLRHCDEGREPRSAPLCDRSATGGGGLKLDFAFSPLYKTLSVMGSADMGYNHAITMEVSNFPLTPFNFYRPPYDICVLTAHPGERLGP